VSTSLLLDRWTVYRHYVLKAVLPGLVEDLCIDVRQIFRSEHYGGPNYNGEGPEEMERKVLFATTRCIWSDHLIDSLGHLMETCKNLRA
jgi:hypothetical protein